MVKLETKIIIKKDRSMDLLKSKIGEYLQENSCSIDKMAEALHVKKMDIITNLPQSIATVANGDSFDTIIEDLQTWGEVLFIKITPSFVIEVKTKISKGSYGHGYYNFDMSQAPLGGHLKADDIDKILFLSAKVMRGMLSHSVQFFDKEGENIFKIYVTRDENREFIQSQLEAYKNLKKQFS